jgi:hypothetical protein
MFAKLATALIVALSALSTGVTAAPLTSSTDLGVRSGVHSFNNYGGFQDMSNFDSFYGSSNFDNSQFSEKSITIVKQQETVCQSQSVEIIQQRLLVLQEMAKRIITEQICEVETQTIVFEQFHSSLDGFSRDLRRDSGRSVGYDSNIASHYNSFYNSDGSLSTSNFGFTGSDLGRSYVSPSGNNYNGQKSFNSVANAYNAAKAATTTF